MLKVIIGVDILFDNGVEETLYINTDVDMTREEAKELANKNIEAMKDLIGNMYSNNINGVINVGNAMIKGSKTLYIKIYLAEIRNIR